mmetsp:Transcript_7613/g.16366  ORF Transcript_7613/g.16366 Transcript_7613/m.16366 type:complete len:242 (-) Transcript_7613:91-816(-)
MASLAKFPCRLEAHPQQWEPPQHASVVVPSKPTGQLCMATMDAQPLRDRRHRPKTTHGPVEDVHATLRAMLHDGVHPDLVGTSARYAADLAPPSIHHANSHLLGVRTTLTAALAALDSNSVTDSHWEQVNREIAVCYRLENSQTFGTAGTRLKEWRMQLEDVSAKLSKLRSESIARKSLLPGLSRPPRLGPDWLPEISPPQHPVISDAEAVDDRRRNYPRRTPRGRTPRRNGNPCLRASAR